MYYCTTTAKDRDKVEATPQTNSLFAVSGLLLSPPLHPLFSLSLSPIGYGFSEEGFPSPLFQSASLPFFALPPHFSFPPNQTSQFPSLPPLPLFFFLPAPTVFLHRGRKRKTPSRPSPPSHNKTGRLFEEMGTNNRGGGPFFSFSCGGKRPYFPPLPLLRLRDARLPLCLGGWNMLTTSKSNIESSERTRQCNKILCLHTVNHLRSE